LTDLLGWRLTDALNVLEEQDIAYRIIETYAPKPLQVTDSARVIRQKKSLDAIELTVGYFKTKI